MGLIPFLVAFVLALAAPAWAQSSDPTGPWSVEWAEVVVYISPEMHFTTRLMDITPYSSTEPGAPAWLLKDQATGQPFCYVWPASPGSTRADVQCEGPSTQGSIEWWDQPVLNGRETRWFWMQLEGGGHAHTSELVVGTRVTLTASITSPASDATVSGTISVSMDAGQATAPVTFQLAVDGSVVSTQTVSGTTASYAWNTTTVANGIHTLSLTVSDNAGHTASATRTISVSNVAPAFTVSFVYPAAGATTGGNQSIGMSTTAPWGKTKTFTISVDGKTVTTSTSGATTLWYTWNTTTVLNGTHAVTVSVTYGGSTVSVSRMVIVRN
jgi:Big-like domain-containing protein